MKTKIVTPQVHLQLFLDDTACCLQKYLIQIFKKIQLLFKPTRFSLYVLYL